MGTQFQAKLVCRWRHHNSSALEGAVAHDDQWILINLDGTIYKLVYGKRLYRWTFGNLCENLVQIGVESTSQCARCSTIIAPTIVALGRSVLKLWFLMPARHTITQQLPKGICISPLENQLGSCGVFVGYLRCLATTLEDLL